MTLTPTAVILIAYYGVVVASLSFAWVRGGRTERTGVILLAGLATLAWALEGISEARFATVDPLALVEDLVGFAGFTWMGLRARRFWPLWAAALQLLSVSAHFARSMDLGVHPMVYSLMKSLPTLLVCIAVATGAATYRRRQRTASGRGYPGAAPASWRRHWSG